ncbi:MAG: insulinase family protein, partial [Oscillospiraceae bacterium]
IFKPCTRDGAFIPEWLEIEKIKLREEIEGEINDKRSYCIKNAQRKFFNDSLNGVERLGYLEEIDAVTPQGLFDCYNEIINNSVVNIFITATNPHSIKQKLTQAFSQRPVSNAAILPPEIMPCIATETFEEKLDIVQGKVCLIYTTKRPLTEKERYEMLVASSILGGTPTARLFKNVREKQSLCYYCAAGFNGFTSSLNIDSGVEHQNMQLTIDAINNELQQLIDGEITQQEIDQTKLTIINSLKTIYDGLHGLEAWYLNENIRGTSNSPQDVIKLVNSVTQQQIKDVLKLFNLNIIYKLTR